MFDPVAERVDPDLASRVVWFDAFVTNVDRTVRNPNMLIWHRKLWLIDHGAALYFHHSWNDYRARSRDAFALVRDHVLLPRAERLAEIDSEMAALITPDLIRDVIELVPGPWLGGNESFSTEAEYRSAYVDYLLQRLEPPRPFLKEAIRARAQHI